ncbi:MAG: 30S ribosomal protein S17 [Patescibacteria group bacterium]|nr:30S ribosomal protein S17 [Patescibacteria group bacterium]
MSKILEGQVVSTKMKKTAIVEVIRRTPHPLYKKLIRKSKKYKVDTGDLTVAAGDAVKIAEIKPVSKDKHFKILEVIKA